MVLYHLTLHINPFPLQLEFSQEHPQPPSFNQQNTRYNVKQQEAQHGFQAKHSHLHFIIVMTYHHLCRITQSLKALLLLLRLMIITPYL